MSLRELISPSRIDPARYHVLAIAIDIANPRQHTVHKVVTSQAVISRLAEALNRSPVQPVQVPDCAAIFAYYRPAFALSWHSRPAVVVSAVRWPCGGAQIGADGEGSRRWRTLARWSPQLTRLLGVTPEP